MPTARECFVLLCCVFAWLSCTGTSAPRSLSSLEQARQLAESGEEEDRGRLYLAELVLPGGRPQGVAAARQQVRSDSIYGSLAAGIDAEIHGRPVQATRSFLNTLLLSRNSPRSDAPLLSWLAAAHLRQLQPYGPAHADILAIDSLLVEPGAIGFRARSELAELRAARPGSEAEASQRKESVQEMGCVTMGRFVGPFGASREALSTKHAPEDPHPWPVLFKGSSQEDIPVRSSESAGCRLSAPTEGAGVFYFETFVELPATSEVLLIAHGAALVIVDDTVVLRRDPHEFGERARLGVVMELARGRHRIVLKLDAPQTTLRLLDPAGRPTPSLGLPSPGLYELRAPRLLPDPNVLDPFLTKLGVSRKPQAPAARAPLDTDDLLLRFIAADLARFEGLPDLANVLLEPLLPDRRRAAAATLEAYALNLETDPIYTAESARSIIYDVRKTAIGLDPELWMSRLWLLTDAVERKGPGEILPQLLQLVDVFPLVATIAKAQAVLLARFGYHVEHEQAVRQAVQRFPNDPELLSLEIPLARMRGETDRANELARHVAKLSPAKQVPLQLALAEQDWAAAMRLVAGNRPAIDELEIRAGLRSLSEADLEQRVRESPKDTDLHLRLADMRHAGGDRQALRRGLMDALRAGADVRPLRGALEVIDGRTGFEAFRFDAKMVIRQYEDTESAKASPSSGAAVRVLDYAALWVKPDGSARMLEHEIVRMTSREAIAEHAEQKISGGTILRMRTIKADGTTHEPERIASKATATMPHLEVGDYVETETIYDLAGDDAGQTFVSPRWYFREAKVDYFRSEFVVITPQDRPLTVETTGEVPAPVIQDVGTYRVRRFRVDKMPALPEEPLSTPIEEFLPSVRVGWGITQEVVLNHLYRAAQQSVPEDPRLDAIAARAATGLTDDASARVRLPLVSLDERARKIYRYVVDNVTQSHELDPRRVVTSKSGDRAIAFAYLARLAGVRIAHGMIQSRLAAPPRGPLSEAESFGAHVLVVPTTDGPLAANLDKANMIVSFEKFVPYGFVPASLRGQPLVLLEPGFSKGRARNDQAQDLVESRGEGVLARDGSLTLRLVQTYSGRRAIELRSALGPIRKDQLKIAVESQLLPQLIAGARLIRVEAQDADKLDASVKLVMELEVSSFARSAPGGLVVSPPLPPSLSSLATLAARETPLYLSEASSTYHAVELRIALPKGARIAQALSPTSSTNHDREFSIRDRLEGETLVLERSVAIPAGRISPEEYPTFQLFVRKLDTAWEREIPIGLQGR